MHACANGATLEVIKVLLDRGAEIGKTDQVREASICR